MKYFPDIKTILRLKSFSPLSFSTVSLFDQPYSMSHLHKINRFRVDQLKSPHSVSRSQTPVSTPPVAPRGVGVGGVPAAAAAGLQRETRPHTHDGIPGWLSVFDSLIVSAMLSLFFLIKVCFVLIYFNTLHYIFWT